MIRRASKFFLIVISFQLLSGCSTALMVSNGFYLEKRDVKAGLIKIEKDSGVIESLPYFVVSRDPKISYSLVDKGAKVASINIDTGCWAYGLGGVIIPIPFFPVFSLPKNYSISVSFKDKNLSSKEVKYQLVVDGKNYDGIKEKLGRVAFPIKCNGIRNGKIVISGLTESEISLDIYRGTFFMYGVGLFMNN